jgi:hypothetical protein
MKILILNWSNGENDPFSLFNETLKNNFELIGRDVVIINLDREFDKNLLNINQIGIDFAITWQGIGSDFKFNKLSENTIWDDLRINLFCIHGDHPSQMPTNHTATSPFVYHFYSVASFTKFANRNIKRNRAAITFKLPVINEKKLQINKSGNYFVIIKNIEDVKITELKWDKIINRYLYEIIITCSESIKYSLNNGSKTDHHEILDDILSKSSYYISLSLEDQKTVFNYLHFEFNSYYRNLLSVLIVEKLIDIPIKIIGKGWERFEKLKNPNHIFLEPNSAKESEIHYYSNWGIIDIAPTFDSLHDRTLRAMSNYSNYIIASDWPFKNELLPNNNLFFNIGDLDFNCKIENIIQNPSKHSDECQVFGDLYKRWATSFELLRMFEFVSMNNKSYI